LKQLKE